MDRQFSGNTRGTPRAEPQTPGTLLPDGTAQGQMLFWDVATQAFVLTAAPTDGEVFVFDSTSGLVVPRPPPINFAFGAQGIISAGAPSFLWPYNENSLSQAAIGAAGNAPIDDAGVIDLIWIINGNPTGATDIVYRVNINAAATAFTITHNSATVAPAQAVGALAVAANSRLTVEAQQASGGSILCRPLLLVRYRPN